MSTTKQQHTLSSPCLKAGESREFSSVKPSSNHRMFRYYPHKEHDEDIIKALETLPLHHRSSFITEAIRAHINRPGLSTQNDAAEIPPARPAEIQESKPQIDERKALAEPPSHEDLGNCFQAFNA